MHYSVDGGTSVPITQTQPTEHLAGVHSQSNQAGQATRSTVPLGRYQQGTGTHSYSPTHQWMLPDWMEACQVSVSSFKPLGAVYITASQHGSAIFFSQSSFKYSFVHIHSFALKVYLITNI